MTADSRSTGRLIRKTRRRILTGAGLTRDHAPAITPAVRRIATAMTHVQTCIERSNP